MTKPSTSMAPAPTRNLIRSVVALLAIGAAVWMYIQKKRTQDLRSKFGPEYDQAIDIHGAGAHAESDPICRRPSSDWRGCVDVHPEEADARSALQIWP